MASVLNQIIKFVIDFRAMNGFLQVGFTRLG